MPPFGTEYRKDSHTVYDLKYHIVWITKYGKKVMRDEIGIRLRELMGQTCEALEVQIVKGIVRQIMYIGWCQCRLR
jgi:putative transposase